MTNERVMLDLLQQRYGKTATRGRGERATLQPPRYVTAEHVRSAPLRAVGIADFMAADTWACEGFPIHGFEVKVSRSDWLSELRSADKAGVFRPYCDYWWLVTSDKSVVRGDLPDGWGLLTATTNLRLLRMVVDAPRNGDVLPMPRGMRAGLLRASASTAKRLAA